MQTVSTKKIVKLSRVIAMLLVLVVNQGLMIKAFAAGDSRPVLTFSNNEAIKYRKILTVGQVEILEFAKAVSLANYGVGDQSLNYIEFDKLKPGPDGYKQFIIKAKKPGYGELTFRSGDDLIKVEVIVQNDYKILEEQLNELFGIKNASESQRIKVTPASYIGDISSESGADAYLYLSGEVDNPKQAMLAVAFAANTVGDHGVKIFSNPGGQLRQKDLDSSNAGAGTQINIGGGGDESFVENYESTNSLIDTDNIHRDLILASEGERVISFLKIKEPKRYAVKVKFLEMDARYLDEFNTSINIVGVGQDVTGSLGSTELAAPGISAANIFGATRDTNIFDSRGLLSRISRVVDSEQQISDLAATSASDLVTGNLASGALRLFDNTFVNTTLNDLLSEGVLNVVNEFSLVIHSGERISLGRGIRFPIPKSNNNVGGQQISIEYIPIGFKGELKVTGLESGLIDAQLASRLSAADAGAATQIQGFAVPVFKEQYVNSGVLLKDGQEVVLNAFLTESESTAKANSPLGRIIPFLGKSKRKERSKTVLFITLKADELEPTSQQRYSQEEFSFPKVDLEKGRKIYSDYVRDLRAKKIHETVNLKEYNKSTDASGLDTDFDDFDTDPLDMGEVEVLPGI